MTPCYVDLSHFLRGQKGDDRYFHFGRDFDCGSGSGYDDDESDEIASHFFYLGLFPGDGMNVEKTQVRANEFDDYIRPPTRYCIYGPSEIFYAFLVCVHGRDHPRWEYNSVNDGDGGG